MEDIIPGASTTIVDVFVDPCCPFAWITSRWIVEVERQRDVVATFHLMSLSVINEHRDLDDWYREFNDRAWGPARVYAAVEAGHGPGVTRGFYEAFTRRFHSEGNENLAIVVPAALAEAGLPASLARAAADATWDTALRSSTRAALDPVGIDVGTPVLHLDGTAVFGPVLTACPRGAAAGRFFDALRTMLSTPGFSELQRRRDDTLDRSDPAIDTRMPNKESTRV
jgi:hypothetical protein